MEDLQLQVAMYNIVFQVYADKVDRHKSMTGYTMCRACFLFVVFFVVLWLFFVTFLVHTHVLCQGDWEEGLKAIEDAMWVTPRTIHRYIYYTVPMATTYTLVCTIM